MGVALAAVLVVSCSSSDDPALDRIDVPPHDSFDPAELQDLASIAEQQDMSLDEAIIRYSWGDDFSRIVSDIKVVAPGAVADAEITGATTAVVRFVGVPPAEATELLRRLEADVPWISVTVVAGAGLSADMANQLLITAYAAIADHPGVPDASGSFDVEARQISIVVATGDGPAVSTDELTRLAEAAIRRAHGESAVEFMDVSVERSPLRSLGGDDSS